MLKQKIGIVICLLLLGGCATAPEEPGRAITPQLKIPADGETALPGKTSGVHADLLYLLVTAEIAGQRGQFDVALDGYLEAAKWIDDPRVAERATQIALYVKDTDKAMQASTLWLSHDPESVSARKVSAILYAKKGDSDKTVESLKILLNSDEPEVENAILEAVKMIDGQSQQGFEVLDRLVSEYPERAEVHYAYAAFARKKKKSDIALKEATRASELRSDWNKVDVLQAQIASEAGDTESAREILQEAVDKSPDNYRLRMIYAQFLVKTEDFDTAEEQFKQIVSDQPGNHDAVFSLALVQLQLKDEEPAKENLLKLVNVAKWKSQAQIYLGRLEAKNDNADGALEWFDQVTSGPLEFDAQVDAVSALAKDDRTDEALRRIEKLHAKFPDQALRIYLMQAELLNDKKDYTGAIDVLNEALVKIPGKSELLYSRALIAERLDRIDVLEADLQEILQKDPDDANALNALGYTLADRTQRLDEADDYLQRAIKLRPDDPIVQDSFGWLQYRLGRHEEALRYLQKAYDQDSDPEIAAHLGEVLWVTGKQDQAKKIWIEALEKDPENEYMAKIKNRFKRAFR